MCDIRGDFLGPPHGATPAAVITKNIIIRSFARKHLNVGNTVQFWVMKPHH